MISALVTLALSSIATPDQVVVYPDRAQVTRVTAVNCGARAKLSFEGVPASAAADSFRARITSGSIDGLRAELVNREKELLPRAEALRKQLDDLEQERRVIEDQATRLQDQLTLSRRFSEVGATMISKEMAVEKPDPKSWQAAIDGTLNSALTLAKQLADVKSKQTELRRKWEELSRQLEEVSTGAAKQSYSVEVLASCANGSTADVSLTYLVGGASWTPVYEARALETEAAVEVSTYATMRQATGEDWSQVELILSTAVPSQNATPPELKKLMVGAWEKAPEKKVLVRREEAVESARVSGGDAQAESGGLVAKNQGLSVQLTVPEKTKIIGDGSPARVFVGKTRMKATFELRAMPKLFPFAFRVAELSNTAGWPLLAGRIDAFRSNGMVGRYELERVAQGAAFTLTFGVDESVRVKRTIVEELKRDQGLFGGKKRFTYSYRFELANYGKANAEVTLADHVPVSELDDIAVTFGEKTTPGYSLGAADGIAKWKVALKPLEKRTLDLTFRVDVPSSYETGGL